MIVLIIATFGQHFVPIYSLQCNQEQNVYANIGTIFRYDLLQSFQQYFVT